MNNDDGVEDFSASSNGVLSYPMKYEEKVRQVLQKLLQPHIRINNEYLKSLLTYLATNNSDLGCPPLSSSIYINWLLHVKESWSNPIDLKPNVHILSFAIELATLISNNELTFDLLKQHKVYETLINLLNPIDGSTPNLKLAFLKLLNAVVNHGKGLAWILKNNYWTYALEMSLTGQTIYLIREGYAVLGKLLDITSRSHQEFCHELIARIMLPFDNNVFTELLQKGTTNLEINSEEIHKALTPTLKLLSHILDNMLITLVETRNFYVYLTLKNKFKLDQRIENLLLIAQSEAFNYDLQEVALELMMHDSIANIDEQNKLNEQVTSYWITKLLEMCSVSITKGHIPNILKTVYKTGFIWQKVRHKVKICPVLLEKSLCYSPDPLSFGDQMFLLQVVPIFLVFLKLRPISECDVDDNDIRMEYFMKLTKMTAAPVWRLIYKLRDAFENCPKIFEYGSLALQYLLKSKKFYNKKMGVASFQGLMYCFYDIVTILKKNPQIAEVLNVEWTYTTLLLTAVAEYIEEFQITWRDSIESIRVMDVAIDFLSIPAEWLPQCVVKALKLVEISISKYMAPNMALLVDKISDSTMTFIGPLLYSKLHDVNWEVRDSALEVLKIISINAHMKFPSFQKVVLDSKLPSLVLKMALNDEEAFVRASALKCLQEMIKVQDFCTEIAEKYDLNEKVIEVLGCDSEGTVRMEAATLMAIIYELDRLPSTEYLNRTYDIMTHSATCDLYWEVKRNALNFWQVVINNHLQQQGMIDGSFPNVVFSKEHRKIINLTEIEVRKRLLKVLDQLSVAGCLHILVTASQDEDDVAVARAAIRQTKQLRQLLDKYKVCDGVKSLKRAPSIKEVKMEPSSYAHAQLNGHKMDVVDDIIRDILSTSDLMLIDAAAANNNNNKNEIANGECHRNRIQLAERKVLSTQDFLMFLVHEDFDVLLESKQQWIMRMDDVGSLLDDILNENDLNTDINIMDCY